MPRLTSRKFGTTTIFRTEDGAFAGEVAYLGSTPCTLYRVDTMKGYAGEVHKMADARTRILDALDGTAPA